MNSLTDKKLLIVILFVLLFLVIIRGGVRTFHDRRSVKHLFLFIHGVRKGTSIGDLDIKPQRSCIRHHSLPETH